MSLEQIILTEGLTKHYGAFKAVRQLNCRVRRGRITGFLGRNGAGKSSTIKMLLGMIKPTSGHGTVLGRRIDNPKDSLRIRRHVAFVGEDKGLYGYMTVEQLIWFTRSFYADWRPETEKRLLRQFRLPLDRKVKALSKGMRTNLALLLALSRRPALLILDEPTEGLDPVSIEELLQTLASIPHEGTTVFFSSHQIAEVERVADDILMIDQGRSVLEMPLEQVRANYRRITFAFAGHPPELPSNFDGIVRTRTNGHQIAILASRNTEAIAQIGREHHAVDVDVSPLSLREIFLETVQEHDHLCRQEPDNVLV